MTSICPTIRYAWQRARQGLGVPAARAPRRTLSRDGMASKLRLLLAGTLAASCFSMAMPGLGHALEFEIEDCVGANADDQSECARTAPVLRGATDLDLSPDGKSAYVAGFEQDSLVELSTRTGLRFKDCVQSREVTRHPKCSTRSDGLWSPTDVLMSPRGEQIFTLGARFSSPLYVQPNLTWLGRRQGDVTPRSCYGFAGDGCEAPPPRAVISGPFDAAVSPTGRHLYVISGRGSYLTHYRYRKGGQPRPVDCFTRTGGGENDCLPAPNLDDLRDVSVSNDGRYVYAVSDEWGTTVFRRDVETGELTWQECYGEQVGCSEPGNDLFYGYRVSSSSNARAVYITGAPDDTVARAAVNPETGELAPKECFIGEADSRFPQCEVERSLNNLREMTVSDDGKRVYTGGNSVVSAFRADLPSGSLTRLGCIQDIEVDAELPYCASAAPGLSAQPDLEVGPSSRSLFVTSSADQVVTSLRRIGG